MDSDRWARIVRIFDAALGQPPEDRHTFVVREGGGDAEIEEEVLSLLAAHAEGGVVGSLEGDAAGPRGPDPEAVGPYRIVSPLGHGGMGTVYLAERSGADFSQRVALKLMRAGLVHPYLEERFRRERRILARLEHTGIAKLIDGGRSDDGVPYIAMEFIEGSTILEYCEMGRLGIDDRLRLFLQVCAALEYAHQQLVVHRDLKPNNILVTANGRAKLLDFGIAKLLDPGAESAQATRTLHFFTPSYASPEQVRRETITTLSDVYQLGVLLYELLTGDQPFALDGKTPAEIERIVCDVVPTRLSEVVRRAGDTRRARHLAGDLDTIVATALAKEPGRRYQSVAKLGDDVSRYLARMPILARPDSVGYRASKFVRRHRTALGATGLVAASLVGGVVTAAWQARVASSAREDAEEALQRSHDVTASLIGLFEASNPGDALADTAVSREILRRGLERAEQMADQPLVQAEMFDALARVFDNLGRYDDAETLLNRALANYRRVHGPEHPDVAGAMRRLAHFLGRRRGADDSAVVLYERALTMQRQLLGPDHPDVAETLIDYARLPRYYGQYTQAEAMYREALAIRRSAFGTRHPLTAAAMGELAFELRTVGQYEEAEALYREQIALQRELLGPDAPEAAGTMIYLGDMLASPYGNPEAAERLYREALAIQERAYGTEHLQLTHVLHSLAAILADQGLHTEARALLMRSASTGRRLLAPEHPAMISYRGTWAGQLFREERYEEAIALYREVIAARRALDGENVGVAGPYGSIGYALMHLGRPVEAEASWRRSLALRLAHFGPDHPLVAATEREIGRTLTAQGRVAEADSVLRGALATMRSTITEEHYYVRQTHDALAELYDAMGRPAAAAAHRDSAQLVPRHAEPDRR